MSSRLGSASRRTGHGGSAWANSGVMLQPQDGAMENLDGREFGGRARVIEMGSRLSRMIGGRTTFLEPEDAGMTGGTRSLVRRLMGLNVTAPRKPISALVNAIKPAVRVGATNQAQVA